MRILLVEDDVLIGTAVTNAFKDSGYVVDWVKDGLQAINSCDTQDYMAILLDLGLPKKSGFEVLNTLRLSKDNTPVIIATAKDAIDDRIKGLDLGADDYITKPYSIDELQARLRAVTRRQSGSSSPIIEHNGICLNPISHDVTLLGEAIQLSAKEYNLLHIMLSQAGKVFSREELEEQLYGWNEEVASNVIEFLIHGLRKKLGKDAIRNIRGLGWVINKGNK